MNTRIGLPTTRLPAGPHRARLLDLAHRGISLLRLDRTPGARLIVHLCNSLAVAIGDLQTADTRIAQLERAVGAANLRIGELQRQVRASEFDEETRRVETPDLSGARRTAVVNVPSVR